LELIKPGVFSLTDIYPGSTDTAASRINDIIRYGILAEQYGLDVFGIGEHHTRAFAVSSPAVVHAAIARATSRITLTTTATVLSVLEPVRVYKDFATLDLVSHGRAEIIAGRSAFAEPFALFGEDIAGLGLPMALGLIGGTIDHAKRLIGLYRSAGRDAGHPDDQLTDSRPNRCVPATEMGGPLARTRRASHHRPPGEPLPRWTQKPHQSPVHLRRGRRLGKRLGGIGRERLDEVADETPPGLRSSVPGGSYHTSVGHQDQRHVLVNEILAQPAGGLGTVKKLGERESGAVALRLERLRGRKRHGEDIGEATVVGLHLADPLDETAEAVPGVGIGQSVVEGGRIGGHLVGERRPHQVVTGGETTEEGGHAHTGATGYLVGGGIQALLSEHLAGRTEHPLAVAFSIGPQPRPGGR
jgi:hypothetical protein